MWKKFILLAAALCMFVASNLTLCCRAELDGTVLEGFYSPRTLQCAEAAARSAAEEICRGEAHLPELWRHYTLRLHPALGREAAISDALLLSSPEIISGVNVYVKGVKLGRIESASALNERLEHGGIWPCRDEQAKPMKQKKQRRQARGLPAFLRMFACKVSQNRWFCRSAPSGTPRREAG